MIQELNEKHTRVKVSNIFHTSNIIKFKRGKAFYFFKEMKTMKLYNKKWGVSENVVRFEFQRTKQTNSELEYWGCNKHDFFNGEKFTDRFEFVNFDDIPEGVEKNYLVDVIKNNCSYYNFKVTNYLTKVLDDSIDHYMKTILKTSNNGGRDYVPENEQEGKHYAQFYGENKKDFDIRLKDTIDRIAKETFHDNANAYEDLRKLAEECGHPIITAQQKTPETIILKKHTHKKNNKIVFNDDYSEDYSDSFIYGIDTAIESNHADDFIVTKQYVSDKLNNVMGIPKTYLSNSNSIMNTANVVIGNTTQTIKDRYSNIEVNPKYYEQITFNDSPYPFIYGDSNDSMKILSRKNKKINNKVCMLEDKLLLL